MSGFGEWLRRTREAQGLSAYAIAQRTGLSRSYLSDLETGRNRAGNPVLPSDETLEKLAPLLDVSVDDLKREALKDRLDDQELAAAAEIAAEHASPKEMAKWVRVHFRADQVPPEEREAYIKEVARMALLADEHWDKL